MKTFPLSILTPEKTFYEGEAASITLETVGGRLSVLAGHIPMVSALHVGRLDIRDPQGKRHAFHSEGFMEVTKQRVTVLCQACEWPEEIDEARAEHARARAKTRIDAAASSSRLRLRSKLALRRATMRLKVLRQPGD